MLAQSCKYETMRHAISLHSVQEKRQEDRPASAYHAGACRASASAVGTCSPHQWRQAGQPSGKPANRFSERALSNPSAEISAHKVLRSLRLGVYAASNQAKAGKDVLSRLPHDTNILETSQAGCSLLTLPCRRLPVASKAAHRVPQVAQEIILSLIHI